MNIKVETHCGYKADEYPTKIWLDESALDVIDIEDRWYGPGVSYFKVFADNGYRYMLKQELGTGVWSVRPI